MSPFTYKVSYLNDPYQQFLSKKTQSPNSQNTNNVNIKDIKTSHRVTELYLNVNDVSFLSSKNENEDFQDSQNDNEKENKNTNILPSNLNTNTNANIKSSNNNSNIKSLDPSSISKTNLNSLNYSKSLDTSSSNPNATTNSLSKKNEREPLTIDTTLKKSKTSSFTKPLLDIKFDVGSLFESDKTSNNDGSGSSLLDDIFKSFSKLDDEEDINNSNNSSKRASQSTIKTKTSINNSGSVSSNGKRASQATIRLYHNNHGSISSSNEDEREESTPTIKRNTKNTLIHDENDDDSIEKQFEKISSSFIDNDSYLRNSNSTIKQQLESSSINLTITNEKETKTKSETKILQEKNVLENINDYDTDMIQSLNKVPEIRIDSVDISEDNNEVNDNINFYHDDEKVAEYNKSFNWEEPWNKNNKKNKDTTSSLKSSESKLSSFSHFTIRSTVKLGKATKNICKRILKRRSNKSEQFPTSPMNIPDNYNEKERAFEEMMLRNDTINITLSNEDTRLTSAFTDEVFPLDQTLEGNEKEGEEEKSNEFYNKSDNESLDNDQNITNKNDNNDKENNKNKNNNFLQVNTITNNDTEGDYKVYSASELSFYEFYDDEEDKTMKDCNDEEKIKEMKKKKNRNRHAGINFEDVLPEGNVFRKSLANI